MNDAGEVINTESQRDLWIENGTEKVINDETMSNGGKLFDTEKQRADDSSLWRMKTCVDEKIGTDVTRSATFKNSLSGMECENDAVCESIEVFMIDDTGNESHAGNARPMQIVPDLKTCGVASVLIQYAGIHICTPTVPHQRK